MKKDKNIFDTATKKLTSKKLENSLSEKPYKNIKKGQSSKKDPEVVEMLEKIETMKQDLRDKMEAIKVKSGWSEEKIQQILDNPQHLSNKQLLSNQQNEQVLEGKIWAALGNELKPKKAKPTNLQSERLGKTLGSRKKWIPMK